jgi:hypothetical protein
MKDQFVLYFFSALLLLTYAAHSAAELDIDLDVGLGSEVGPSISSDELIPFFADLKVGYDTGVVKPFVAYGHVSSADVNGGDRFEYAGERYSVGAEAVIRNFYGSVMVSKFADNTFERETTPVMTYELGISDEFRGFPFRVAAWYEDAQKGGYIERAGIKVAYSFDLK